MGNDITSSQDKNPEMEDFNIDFSATAKKIVGIIKDEYILISSIVAGIVLIGTVVTLLITPRYQASSQILIEDQADQIIENVDLQQAVTSSDTDRFLRTQLGIIESRTLASAVIQKNKFDTNPEFFEALGEKLPTEADDPTKKLEEVRHEAAIDALLEALSVQLPTDSRIATITVTSYSPELSATLANEYATQFIQYNLNQKYNSSSYAREFLEGQLQDARRKLTQSEHDLNQYAREAGLIRISSDSENGSQETALSVTNSKLMELNNASADATAERIAAEDRWKTLASKAPLSISEVNSNTAVMHLVTAKAQAEGDLAEELSQHREDYATVKAKRAEIAELDRRITAIANSIKQAAETNYQAALKRENSLLEQVAILRDEALSEQERGVQYSVLKRVAETNRTLYESLLSRFNQLSASAGASVNNVTVVDKAVVPASPSSPNVALNIIFALILGIICAAAVIALKELFDDAIRSPEDVEKKLGMRLLGLIPLFKSDEPASAGSTHTTRNNEAYRSLVTNLSYSTAGGLPQVLIVTSTRESEGKSTTARNIAMDIASLGKKTLLIDADLRRPTLQLTMGSRNEFGLAEYLTGQKSFSEITRPSAQSPLLSYVTALPIPPDPSLLLAGPLLGAFFKEAREQFEVVIVDAPPLLGLSDVPLLAQYADALLYVVDASTFYRGSIKSALRRLSMINVQPLGIVLNRFSPKAGSSEYDYYTDNYYTYGTGND